MNSRISIEYVSIESRRDHELLLDCYILEISQISIQFLILFGRHYGRNTHARPPSCSIFLPMCFVGISSFLSSLVLMMHNLEIV